MGILRDIINTGTDRVEDDSLKSRIATSNVASIILIFVLAGPYVVITYMKAPAIAFIPIIAVIVGLVSLLFNKIGLHFLGRLLISIAPVSLAGFYHAFLIPKGAPVLNEFGFVTFGFSMAPFIVFKIEEYLGWVSGFLYGAIWIIGFKGLTGYFETEEVLDSSFISETIFAYLTSGMAVVFGSGGVFSLSYQNMLVEKKNDDAQAEMVSKQQQMLDSQNELKQTLEEIEVKKLEEEKRMWANDGMVKFSEILRNNTGEDLYSEVISDLVKYVGAKQGKIYKANDESKQVILELCATYAYDRFKFEDESLEIGEGLVGEAYQEGEIIHLNEIPENYTSITSGLGEANPSAILIFPLMNEEVIEGIIELASFNEFEEYQIEFLHKVGINIATTISREKINNRTSLLLEESKQQTEMMQQQEEEMRQNMEEMQATQDMMDEKEAELLEEIKKLKKQLK